MTRVEKTVAMIKPDAVQDGHVDAIINRIQENGFKILRRQDGKLTEDKVKGFYRNIAGKPFFKDLCAFMIRWV